MKKIKVAVAGLGRIGKIHLTNLCQNFPELEVVAVMDIIIESKSIADQFMIPKFEKNFDDLLAVPGLDAVIICSPTDTHADYVIKAAKAGKQIFCEKPLDLSLAQVAKTLDVVEQSGVKLMLGFNRRFDPNFLKIKSMVDAGQVGDPQILKITSRDPGPPPISYIKVSGGLFMDMAIHDFDMARYIMNKEVVEVYSRGAVLVDPAIGDAGDIDTALTTLTFEDGTMANIDNSRKAVYGYDQRLEVFGSKGMVKADNNFPDNHQHYSADGIHGSLPLNFFLERYTTSYLNEMAAFFKSIRTGEDLPVSGKDGLEAMKIALAALKSVKENRPVLVYEVS
ncbi:MAG: inositol 2-dehydrogenase [Cyclobacteriaceae bacterium]|nr:inositol 2-dehydrogenase [Cyclobacteriaceae bacterium]